MKSGGGLPKFSSLSFMSGHGAAWLARLSGGQEVPSSNLGGPTIFRSSTRTPPSRLKARSLISLRFLIPPIALLATIAWGSSFDKSSPQGPDLDYFDKVAHFFVFGLLSTLWYRWLPGGLRSSKRFAWAFALTIVYGIVDEWIQSYNPLRTSDPMDIVADGVGAIVAIVVYCRWRFYRRVLETPILDLLRLKIAPD